MAIVNPEHLFELADDLAAAPAVGPPRQANLRRALSTAYYALFHFVLTGLADEFVGKTKRGSTNYALVYRRLDHAALKSLCLEVQRPSPSPKIAPFGPAGGFGSNIAAFGAVLVDLQEKRHQADYDPAASFKRQDAFYAISAARRAVRRFERAKAERRKAFLTLLLCPPR